MSSTWNGHHMAIGYGGAGTVSDTLAIGRNYCHRHLDRIPRLSRDQLIRLGCVFPPKSPKLPDRPKKATRGERPRPITPDDVARILAGYEAGKSVTAIAISVKRATSAVRRVLIGNGKDPSRFANRSPMRIRAVELLRAGKSPEEIAPEIGAALSYVRNIASNVRRAESVERKEAA